MANKIEIVSDADAVEDASYVVCVPVDGPLIFPDNLVGECCKCGVKVQFRPNAPVVPPRICLPCVLPEMDQEADEGNLTISVTENSRQEVHDFFKRKNKLN